MKIGDYIYFEDEYHQVKDGVVAKCSSVFRYGINNEQYEIQTITCEDGSVVDEFDCLPENDERVQKYIQSKMIPNKVYRVLVRTYTHNLCLYPIYVVAHDEKTAQQFIYDYYDRKNDDVVIKLIEEIDLNKEQII